MAQATSRRMCAAEVRLQPNHGGIHEVASNSASGVVARTTT